MAPPHKNSKTDIEDTENSDKPKPDWNGSDLDLRPWCEDLPVYLYGVDQNIKTFITRGIHHR